MGNGLLQAGSFGLLRGNKRPGDEDFVGPVQPFGVGQGTQDFDDYEARKLGFANSQDETMRMGAAVAGSVAPGPFKGAWAPSEAGLLDAAAERAAGGGSAGPFTGAWAPKAAAAVTQDAAQAAPQVAESAAAQAAPQAAAQAAPQATIDVAANAPKNFVLEQSGASAAPAASKAGLLAKLGALGTGGGLALGAIMSHTGELIEKGQELGSEALKYGVAAKQKYFGNESPDDLANKMTEADRLAEMKRVQDYLDARKKGPRPSPSPSPNANGQ
jgi:hypothetical protein